MSIDFSTLKSLTIPEGKTVKITDASGRVMWAKPNSDDEMVTVTITGTGRASCCYVTVDGTTYTSAATLSVPVGTIITCHTDDEGKDGDAFTSVNDSLDYKYAAYDYTVTGNVSLHLDTNSYTDKDDEKYYYGNIYIHEE